MGDIKLKVPGEFHQLSVELAKAQRFFGDHVTGSPQGILHDMFLRGYQPSELTRQELFELYQQSEASLCRAQEAYRKLGQFLVSLREKGIEVEF